MVPSDNRGADGYWSAMIVRDPEKNFEALWRTFQKRYPFFALRKVDWQKQYDTYRPRVTKETGDDELFDIFRQMLDPLDDGHVELIVKAGKNQKKDFSVQKRSPDFGENLQKSRSSSF